MLTWIFWKIPSPCYISFHEPCQDPTNSVGEWELYSLHIHYHDSISSPLSLHFFYLIYHSPTFLFQRYFVALCFILINIHIGMLHKYYKKGFLMHIDSLWFLVSIYIIIAAREQEVKWMLLTQEPTFFVFMVVTQEPTIRKWKLLLMPCTYPGNIHY